MSGHWLSRDDCRVEDLTALVDRRTLLADHPHAVEVRGNVPVYDGDALRRWSTTAHDRRAVLAEWGAVFSRGAGLVVLQRAFDDTAVVDAVTREFQALIAEQQAANQPSGDHFAKPGANDRVWNAQQKLCLRAPEAFARYHANPVLAMVCEAWLGPAYQVTAQVNVVNPGGEAQQPHRDYHLGFMTPDEAEACPAHVHHLSPALTLQGAVAHGDMPLESGPTLYLPYSQAYAHGYLAWPRPEFRALFEERKVQLPLAKGDAVFFNPALFHAAGHNRSAAIRRMANLWQVSSATGRAMETLDRTRMSLALYPALRALLADGALSFDGARHAVAACAEGYAFPTNLDLDPPLGGLAPPSQQALMLQALSEGWDTPAFADALQAQARRRCA
jgi:ectoine hydroxylase-related dioxygenase (phytanoyl-CoA dioxygenase family)